MVEDVKQEGVVEVEQEEEVVGGEKQVEEAKEEVEMPSRILDLLASFVDSSADPQYYFNKPPFMKIIKDGSYWQFSSNCVRLVTWRREYSVCDEITVTVYNEVEKIHEFDPLPRTLLSVVFTNPRRQRKISLFAVYRKLLFFEQLYKQYLNNK